MASKTQKVNKKTVISNAEVQSVFDGYPSKAKEKLLHLRALILEVAEENGLTDLEETLKWGEPCYLTKHGSTLRMDWKAKSPDQYAMYFKCTSKLVPSFKLAFDNLFRYEKTRAIVFDLEADIPTRELKQCIKATLTYHKVKQLPLLGIGS